MGVVGQQGPCIDRQMSLLRQTAQTTHEVSPVAVLMKDRTPFNAPHHDVVQGAGSIEPCATWHRQTLSGIQ